MVNKAILVLSVLISGCVTSTTYTGKVENCFGHAIDDVTITAFRNSWIPFSLPPSVGVAKSNDDGSFVLNTKKPAHFLSHIKGDVITINENTKLSINKCKQNT